ncbi:transglycosylase SLT domain-containing protein [Neoroseomonas eburnea]|nr:transglycosylase SLT domain-containing protein [Neoroseomonas eburnea]
MAGRRRRRLLSPIWTATMLGAMALSAGACAQPAPFETPILAEPVSLRDADLSPRTACLEAAREAERKHGLPEGLLVGIALNESGLHAHALSIGGRAYYPEDRAEAARLLRASGGRAMAGCVQVNSGVHARGGQDWPLDPWKATEWAAIYLRQHYETYGDWGMAVVRWHGGSPGQFRQLVCRVRSKIDVVAPDSHLFVERCRGTQAQMAQFRRNGRALLELAEAAD